MAAGRTGTWPPLLPEAAATSALPSGLLGLTRGLACTEGRARPQAAVDEAQQELLGPPPVTGPVGSAFRGDWRSGVEGGLCLQAWQGGAFWKAPADPRQGVWPQT